MILIAKTGTFPRTAPAVPDQGIDGLRIGIGADPPERGEHRSAATESFRDVAVHIVAPKAHDAVELRMGDAGPVGAISSSRCASSP